MLNRLAHATLKDKNPNDLMEYPTLQIDKDARSLGMSAKELIEVYLKCVENNPVQPSAPPMDMFMGCPPNSMLNRLAHATLIDHPDLRKLREDPTEKVVNDAKFLGMTAQELVDAYINCVENDREQPSAPPMDGGRRRSRKYKNRRSSKRSKRCKRSRRRN
jgi:hypothetical protein